LLILPAISGKEISLTGLTSKHSSLFSMGISDEEKSFLRLTSNSLAYFALAQVMRKQSLTM
jgi:hypothetical protein